MVAWRDPGVSGAKVSSNGDGRWTRARRLAHRCHHNLPTPGQNLRLRLLEFGPAGAVSTLAREGITLLDSDRRVFQLHWCEDELRAHITHVQANRSGFIFAVIEDRQNPIKVSLGKRVVFVVVALGAPHRQSQKGCRDGVDLINKDAVVNFVGILSPFEAEAP